MVVAFIVDRTMADQPCPMSTLAEVLARETREGELYDTLPDGRLRCFACGHRCPLPDGAVGVCKVRFNEGGRLRVPWGYVGGVQCDPIEKKPFFHALSRRARLQLRHARLRSALRLLPELGHVAGAARSGRGRAAARRVARATRRATRCASGARVIVSTYNEPLITSEWAVAVFKEAQSRGPGRPASCRTATARRRCSTTSARGSISTRSISRASTIATTASSAAGCSRSSTRSAGCTRWASGSRSSRCSFPASTTRDDELTRLTAFVAGVSPDIPWHVTAFHGDYKMTGSGEHDAGDAADAAAEIGRGARPALRLRRQPAGRGRRPRRHALRARAATRSSRATATSIRDYRLTAGRPLSRRARTRCRAAGAPLRRPDRRRARSCPDRAAAPVLQFAECIADRHASGGRCATCACRSPTAATCAASTACRRRTTSGCRARTSCTSRRSARSSTSSSRSASTRCG